MWGERNCLSFETVVGGIEPPSPRLRVRHSTVRSPLPTNKITKPNDIFETQTPITYIQCGAVVFFHVFVYKFMITITRFVSIAECVKTNLVNSIANGTSYIQDQLCNGLSFDIATLRNVNGDLISFSMAGLDLDIDFRDAPQSVISL